MWEMGDNMDRLPIAAQVYSVREEAAADFDGTMERLAGMGYEGVELAGLYGMAPEEVRACLDRHGLKAVSAHVPCEEFEQDLEGTLEAYKTLGCLFLAVPYLGRDRWYGGSRYQETLDLISRVAESSGKAGIQLLYHNHDFEFGKAAEGGYQLDAFYQEERLKHVAAELDLCWVKVGGADPVEYLQKYSGRCPLVHVKDFVREGAERKVVLVAVGDGELGVESVAVQAAASGAEWLVVEQDDHAYGTPMENMKKSIDCIKRVRF